MSPFLENPNKLPTLRVPLQSYDQRILEQRRKRLSIQISMKLEERLPPAAPVSAPIEKRVTRSSCKLPKLFRVILGIG